MLSATSIDKHRSLPLADCALIDSAQSQLIRSDEIAFLSCS